MFRKRLGIRVNGSDIPHPCPSFHNMALSSEIRSTLLTNIEKSGFVLNIVIKIRFEVPF